MKVVHCKREPYDVYIGRPSEWGNPFSIGTHGDRVGVIELYREWLASRPALMARARVELKGKVLGCFCAPLACHGDILLEIANKEGHMVHALSYYLADIEEVAELLSGQQKVTKAEALVILLPLRDHITDLHEELVATADELRQPPRTAIEERLDTVDAVINSAQTIAKRV